MHDGPVANSCAVCSVIITNLKHRQNQLIFQQPIRELSKFHDQKEELKRKDVH